MGVYRYDDPQTGQGYDLNIVGDTPTDEEFARLAGVLQQDRADFGVRFEDRFGEAPEEIDDGTAFGRGLDRGVPQIKQAFGETLGTIGEQSGLGFLANYGQGLEERSRQELGELLLEQPERMQSTDVDGFGSALTYAGELVGEQIPQLGLGLAGAGTAAIAAPLLGAGALATSALGFAGYGVAQAPILFGNNIQRREDVVGEGNLTDDDIYNALKATFGQAALESISGKLLLRSPFKSVGKDMAGAKGLFVRTTGRATGGATTEGLTEIGQQIMERAQAGLPIDSEEAYAEYREAGIAGGLIGGGARATLGSFGERGDTTPVIPTTDQTPEQEAAAAIEAQADAVLADDVVENSVETAVEEQVSPAQQTEERNAADPAPLEGAAQQTDAERGEAALATGAGLTTQTAAQTNDAQRAVDEAARDKAKADKKAQDTTNKLMPNPNPAPAVGVDQTNKNIKVESLKDIDAEARQALVDDPNLLKRDEDFIREELDVVYSPEVIDAIILQKRELKEQVIDDDFLANLSVPKQALIRRKGTKKSLIGKKVSDEGVLDELREYAKISSVPKAKEGVQGFLDTLEVEDAGTRSTGLGDGAEGSGSSVVGSGRAVPERRDTSESATLEQGSMGTGVPFSGPPAVDAGSQSDTLEAESEVTPDERGVAAIRQLAEQATATPVQQAEPPAMQQAAIPGEALGTARQLIPGAKVRVDKQNLQATGPAQLVDDMYTAPRTEPVIGASLPQADIQAMETEQNAVAQAELDRRFAFKKNEGVREYHDTQVNERSLPDITTSTEKDTILALLETPDTQLKGEANANARAAKLFFKRFRRPVDALDEMGSVSAKGPIQQAREGEKVSGGDIDGRFYYGPKEFKFYEGMTQEAAMEARRWVKANMSNSAMAVTRDAAVLARRDTSKFNPSDAYIGVVNAAKAIQKDINREARKQQNKDVKALAEMERLRAANDSLNKRMNERFADSPLPREAQTIRLKSGEEVVRVTRPVKGKTAFESYLIGTGLQIRENDKVSTVGPTTKIVYDPKTKSVVPTEEILDLYDGYVSSRDEFLLIDPVHGLDMALLPSIRNALQRGDLQFALNAIASTSQVDRIRQIAGKLAEAAGTTQVQVVDDLQQMVGRKAAGMFEPETNTIYIDASNGMNVHTILHEMTHAATSASLANPSLPEVKQLQTIFNAVREQFGEVYGTANLDEFVAEAFSNPEFQSALALTKVDGGKMSGWEKFTGAIKRIVRKILGLSPSASALTEVDRIIDGMLAPSPATRAAPNMLLAAGTPNGSAGLAKSAVESVPPSKKEEYVEMASDIVYNTGEPALRGAKNVILGSLDSRILADVAKKKIPFAPELNILIRKMSGAMRSRSDTLDAMVNNYAAWARKNKAGFKTLNNIIPKSTALRVDPSLPREFYSSYKTAYHDLTTKKSVVKEFKSEKARLAWVKNFNANVDESKNTKAKNMKDPDPQDLVAYDALRKQYNSLGKEGQAFYRQMRNFFQDTYDEILPALRARLEATISDPATRASAFEKLSDILMKESGIIRPYFPLMRKGKHRLQYDFIDENGQRDQAVEYYQNRKSLDRAFKLAEQKIAVDIAAGKLEKSVTPHYTRADQPMNFNAVPSSSFVYDILKTMEVSRGNFRDKDGKPDAKAYEAAVQSVVDLALDAMPERSFMQGFRRRKDVRGYIGDTTPTKVGDTEFDSISMMKEKGRDLNRQIVQIQAAAEIEKFRTKLKDGNYLSNPETADIARKLDQIAAFAQKPNVPRWSQVANGVGFNMTMGLNFSSAAITFFDVVMSAMPIISAEYGVGKTAAAYGAATRLIINAPKTRGVMVSGPDGTPIEQEVKMGVVGKSAFNYTFEQLPPEMQKIRADILFETAADQGQANQSMTQESLEIGRDAPLEGVNKWTSAMFHHSERVNRETTLTAAYALEVQKLQSEGKQLTDQDYKDAAQKAIETTEFTLGSTAAAGRPVWAQSGVGNVLFLFKRFAIAKYYMMYKLGHESIGSTNIETIMQEQGVTEAEAQQIANDRRIARAGLRNFLITTGIMAGAGGMPMMGTFGLIYNMLRDDDEDDFESAVRKFTGEGIYGGLANQVLGVDVANRIALNSLLYRPPLVKKEDQSPLWTLAEQLGGPVVGISVSALRGSQEIVEGISDGDTQAVRRGAETVVPAAIRNFAKAGRFYFEGANTRRGDPITEDINAYNIVMQGLGFAPRSYIQQLEFNKNARRREEAVSSTRTKLLRRHNMALREGDREEVRKIKALIREYNEGLPKGAEKSRITTDTISRSNRSFERTTGKMQGGMTYTPFMEQIVKEYDRGFQGF